MLQPLTALVGHSHQTSKVRSIRFGPNSCGEADLAELAHESPQQAIVLRMTPEWALAHLDALASFHRARPVGAVIVDEAHVVTSWGDSFRPTLANLATLRDQALSSPRPPMLAISATIPVGDAYSLAKALGMHTGSYRLVRYNVITRPTRQDEVLVPTADWAKQILPYAQLIASCKTLIFCQTVKVAEAVAEALGPHLPSGIRAATAKAREQTDAALAWFKDAPIAAIAATDVLAMGVDVPDVSLVVHCGLPDSQASYVQKMGRAGRTGGEAASLLLFTRTDYNCLMWRAFQPSLTVAQQQRVLDEYEAVYRFAIGVRAIPLAACVAPWFVPAHAGSARAPPCMHSGSGRDFVRFALNASYCRRKLLEEVFDSSVSVDDENPPIGACCDNCDARAHMVEVSSEGS